MALVSVASCGDNIVDPKLPVGAARFTPPAVYTIWWDMAKSCSGRSGSLSEVTWYTVPAGVPLESDGKPATAYWSAGSNQIVLSESVVDAGQVVRHEMLHALLRKKGHSRDQFLGRCAGYVTCTDQCVKDAGPGPAVPSSVARVNPSAIEVTMAIAPIPLFSKVNDGYFTITVKARNPMPNPVVVVLPTLASSDLPVTFSYQILGAGGDSDLVFALDGSAASFASGETKLHVFDLFVDNNGFRRGHIFPGLYLVSAAYGGKAATQQSLQAH